jgi:hypothetical protein
MREVQLPASRAGLLGDVQNLRAAVPQLVTSMRHTPGAKPKGVDLLLYHTAAWLVHVHEAAAGVHQRLELFAAAGQLQHLLCA